MKKIFLFLYFYCTFSFFRDDNGAEPASSFYGIVGNIRREGPETRIDFSEVVTHPDYAQSQGETGDIALFRVSEPVPYTDLIRPICLTSAGRDFEKEEVTAVGWGVTSTSTYFWLISFLVHRWQYLITLVGKLILLFIAQVLTTQKFTLCAV